MPGVGGSAVSSEGSAGKDPLPSSLIGLLAGFCSPQVVGMRAFIPHYVNLSIDQLLWYLASLRVSAQERFPSNILF